MARRSAAPYRVRERNGFAVIDFDFAGHRTRKTLEDERGNAIPYHPKRPSQAETRAAQEAAAKFYAQTVGGRVVRPTGRVTTSARLEEAIAMWLDAIETPTNKKSVATHGGYGRHWDRFAADASRLPDGTPRWKGDHLTPLERLVGDAGPEDYATMRLGSAIRETVRKELVSLYQFFRWLKTHKMLASVPPRYAIPASAAGVRTGPQRSAPVEIEPHEARAIIDALPEWSNESKEARHSDRRFRVRDVFEFAWETGLRPSTIARLSVPKNYARGRARIVLTDADDKARFGRELPLTSRARGVLDRCSPVDGPIFGEHDYRHFIKSAALTALPKSKAVQFASYDFRHGRALHLLETSGNLPGVSYLLGHKQMTTTNEYLRSNRRQAEDVLATVDSDTVPSPASAPVTGSQAKILKSLVNVSRGEWIRTTDPQTPSAVSSSFTDESGVSDDEPPSQKPPKIDNSERHSVTIPSPLTDAARGLAVQRAVWDAFDLFALEAEDGGDR